MPRRPATIMGTMYVSRRLSFMYASHLDGSPGPDSSCGSSCSAGYGRRPLECQGIGTMRIAAGRAPIFFRCLVSIQDFLRYSSAADTWRRRVVKKAMARCRSVPQNRSVRPQTFPWYEIGPSHVIRSCAGSGRSAACMGVEAVVCLVGRRSCRRQRWQLSRTRNERSALHACGHRGRGRGQSSVVQEFVIDSQPRMQGYPSLRFHC